MSLNYNKLILKWQKLGLEGLKEELMTDGSQEAQIILNILNMCSSILEKYPEQLPSQLVANFRDPKDNFILDFALEVAKADNITWLMPIAPFPPTEEACVATLHKHSNFVGSIVCLSNTEFISSSEDGTMRVWDLDTKQNTKILTEHTMPINWMHYTPGKKHLLSASDDYTVKIWNISDWTVWRTLKGHSDYVSKVSETNTDLIVSISRDQTVKVWNFNSGACLHTLEGHNSWVYCLAVAPDGSRAITASVNSTMIVWDLISGKNLRNIVDGGGDVTYIAGLILGGSNYSEKGHKEYPLYAQWLDDGRIISASKDIIIWNDSNYTIAKRLDGHPWKIHGFVLSHNKKYLISVANSIKIWDLETGKNIISLIGHNKEEIYSIAITPNEKYVLTGDKKGIIKIWDLESLFSKDRVTGHTSWAGSISISPDGNLVATGGYDETAVIWDVKTGKPRHHLKGHSGMGVNIIGFRSNGKELLTSSSGEMRIWNTENGELLKKVNYAINLFTIDNSLILEGEKQVFCTNMSYRPTLWDLEKGKVNSFELKFGFTFNICVSQDGHYLLACSYPTNLLDEGYVAKPEPNFSPVYLWDLKENKVIREFWFVKQKIEKADAQDTEEIKIYPTKVTFSSKEDKVIAGFSNGYLCIWKRDSGEIIKFFKASNDYFSNFFLTFDEKIATFGQNDNLIRIWSLEDYKISRTIPILGPKLNNATISEDRKIIAGVIEKNTIVLVDLKENKVISTLTLPKPINELKFSENRLFVATSDGLLYGFEIIQQ